MCNEYEQPDLNADWQSQQNWRAWIVMLQRDFPLIGVNLAEKQYGDCVGWDQLKHLTLPPLQSHYESPEKALVVASRYDLAVQANSDSVTNLQSPSTQDCEDGINPFDH